MEGELELVIYTLIGELNLSYISPLILIIINSLKRKMQHCLMEGHVVAHLHMTERDSMHDNGRDTASAHPTAHLDPQLHTQAGRHHQNRSSARTPSTAGLLEVSSQSESDSLEATPSPRPRGDSDVCAEADGHLEIESASAAPESINALHFEHIEDAGGRFGEREGKDGRHHRGVQCDAHTTAGKRSRRSLNSTDYLGQFIMITPGLYFVV